MDYLTIENVRPYDGRYEFDLEGSPLTTREWGWVKRLSGYLPLTVDEGFRGGDPELYAAFAIVALHRAGRIERGDVTDVYERIQDAPFGATIRLEMAEPVEEEGETEPDPTASGNENGNTSGDGFLTNSETLPASPRAYGRSGLDDLESAPETLAT